MIVRGVAALIALATLSSGCSCEGSEVLDAPPSPAIPHEAPTVLVPQVLPAAPGRFGWLDDERALLLEGDAAYVWEPTTDRVLAVVPLDELAPLLPWDWPSDDFERSWRTPFGTTLARTFDAGREFALLDGERALAQFARGGGREGVVFSPDHRRAALCDETGLTLRELGRGAVVGRREAPCRAVSWEADRIAVVEAAGAVVLHASTLEPAFGPVARAAQVALGGDGAVLAVVLTGSREGISVISLATGEEIMHRGMPAPDELRVVGDAVVYEVLVGSGGAMPLGVVRGGVISVRDGSVLVDEREDVALQHLGPAGLLVRTELGVAFRGPPDGPSVVHEPVTASISLSAIDHGLDLRSDRRRWWVGGTLEPQRFGACPEPPRSPFVFWRRIVRDVAAGERHHAIGDGCVAHDDGTTTTDVGASISAVGSDGTLVVLRGNTLSLRAPSGASVRLATDDGEPLVCSGVACPMEFVFVGDRYLLVARERRLRTFDTRTGARVGDAAVLAVTIAMAANDELLVHEAVEPGPRREITIFDLPSLRRRGSWVPPEGPRPTTFDGPGFVSMALIERERRPTEIVEVSGGVLRRRSARGAVLAEVAVPSAYGFLVLDDVIAVRGGSRTRVWRWPDLTDLGEFAGTLEAGGDGELVVCDGEGPAQRVLVDGDVASVRPLGVRCPASFRWLGRGLYAARTSSETLLIRSDDAVMTLFARLDGDTITWTGIADGVAYGLAPVMLRQPTMISDGMIDAPRGGSVADWIASR